MEKFTEHHQGIQIISGLWRGSWSANVVRPADAPASGSYPGILKGVSREEAVAKARVAIDQHPLLSIMKRRDIVSRHRCSCTITWVNGKIEAKATLGRAPVPFQTEALTFEEAAREFRDWADRNQVNLKAQLDKNRAIYVRYYCPEGTVSRPAYSERWSRCWNCHKELSTICFDECSSCGWMVCDCGTCGCGSPFGWRWHRSSAGC